MKKFWQDEAHLLAPDMIPSSCVVMFEDDLFSERLSWMPEYVSGEKDRTLHYAPVGFFRYYMIPSSRVVIVEDDFFYIYINTCLDT